MQQLGFRIAKLCHAKIYCADARGTQTARIEELLEDDSTKQYQDFEESFVHSPDSSLYFEDQPIFKQKGILPQLIHLNDPEHIKRTWVTILSDTLSMNLTREIIQEPILNQEDGSTAT